MESKVTLNKMIYSIKEEFNQYSDDSTFSDEFLALQIGQLRSDFIYRNYNSATNFIPDSLYSKICMNLERHPDDCYEDINVLRTDKPLPAYFNFSEKKIIKALSLGSLRIKYLNYVSLERIPYFTSGRYVKEQLYYSIDSEGRLLIITSEKLLFNTEVSLKIVVQNPEEAYELRCDKSDDTCDFFDTDYPIDGTTYNVVMTALRQQLFNKFRIPEDNINDGTNTNQQVPNHTYDNYDRARRRDQGEKR